MAIRKHYATIIDSEGVSVTVRLWDYFRENRKDFSSLGGKLDAEVRTISIKNALKKRGWKVVENATEVFVIRNSI